MDYRLLTEHIVSFNDAVVVSAKDNKLKADGSNAKDFFVADVIGNKKFAQNYGGYPRSEIAEINSQTNLEIVKSMLGKIEDYTPSSNPNAGLSDYEISLSHKSRYQQTATEMQSYLEEQIALRDAKRAAFIAERQKAAEKLASSLDKSPDNVVNVQPE